MTAYSITPEGATEAAREILEEHVYGSYEEGVAGTAAIILRHAEQSPDGMKTPWCLNGHEVLTPGCESCLLDLQKRYNDALRKAQGEGEMREALRKLRTSLAWALKYVDKYGTATYEANKAIAEALLGPAGREEKHG